jgi:hypothetical protein
MKYLRKWLKLTKFNEKIYIFFGFFLIYTQKIRSKSGYNNYWSQQLKYIYKEKRTREKNLTYKEGKQSSQRSPSYL